MHRRGYHRFLIFIKLFCFHTHYLLVLFLVLLRGQFKDIFTSFSPLRRPCPSRLHNKKIKNRQLTPSKYWPHSRKVLVRSQLPFLDLQDLRLVSLIPSALRCTALPHGLLVSIPVLYAGRSLVLKHDVHVSVGWVLGLHHSRSLKYWFKSQVILFLGNKVAKHFPKEVVKKVVEKFENWLFRLLDRRQSRKELFTQKKPF